MTNIKTILQGPNNDSISSKRVWGSIYLGLGAFLALMDFFKQDYVLTFEVWTGIVVTGTSLLGLGLVEYFSNLNKEKKE